MALIDDDRRVLGEHWNALECIDCEHRVVRDDDVGLLRLKAPFDREALLAEGATALTDAFTASDGQRPPDPRVDVIRVVVAIAGRGLLRPLANGNHLLGQCALLGGEQRVGFVLGDRTVQLLEADVVVASLENGKGHRTRQRRAQGLRHAWQVAVDELLLQGEGRCCHDDCLVLGHGMQCCRHQVAERLSGAGARLDDDVAVTGDRRAYGVRHRVLALAPLASELGHHRLEGGIDLGWRLSHRGPAPARLRAISAPALAAECRRAHARSR